MKSNVGSLVIFLLAAGAWSGASAKDLVQLNTQVVAGWVEPIYLGVAGIPLTAKLDTGANTSSLHAANLKTFTRQDKPWVVFTIQASNGKKLLIEQPVIRTARIRRAGAGVTERPVISLPVCLAGYRDNAEFTLTDRSAMNYAVLIGRAFLATRIIVKSGATNMTLQSCEQ